MNAAYLRVQGIMRVVVYGAALALPVAVTFNYILVGGTVSNFSVAGVAIADAMGLTILCALPLVIVIGLSGQKKEVGVVGLISVRKDGCPPKNYYFQVRFYNSFR